MGKYTVKQANKDSPNQQSTRTIFCMFGRFYKDSFNYIVNKYYNKSTNYNTETFYIIFPYKIKYSLKQLTAKMRKELFNTMRC